jgi:hypothetical protein
VRACITTPKIGLKKRKTMANKKFTDRDRSGTQDAMTGAHIRKLVENSGDGKNATLTGGHLSERLKEKGSGTGTSSSGASSSSSGTGDTKAKP